MNEKEFIYGSIKHLNEQINFLTDIIDKQVETIGSILGLIQEMQTTDYARKQVKSAEYAEILEKVEFIKKLRSK